MRYALAVTLLVLSLTCFAKDKCQWETGVVISQDFTTEDRGTYAVPLGRGVVAVPIVRERNVVVVQTAKQRMRWLETGDSGSIIFPVTSTIQFCREKEYFVVLDLRKKKHFFSLAGLKTLENEEAVDNTTQ